MSHYLDYSFTDTPESTSTFDEAPLWSSAFGLLLLKHLELKPNLTVVDIGSGTGFPLLELAQRLGNTCTCYGIDTWTNANNRARQKITNYGITNAKIIGTTAELLPFEDASVDLIVSNLGINNFDNPDKVFKECSRVMKPGARLALTTNLHGHWQLFYDIFEETLVHFNMPDLVTKLKEHQEHRGTVTSISKLFTENGMSITRHFEEQMEMKFVNGSAFLNHSFVKLGWLASWRDLIPEDDRENIFSHLENSLNLYSRRGGGLTLSVPMAFVEGVKK